MSLGKIPLVLFGVVASIVGGVKIFSFDIKAPQITVNIGSQEPRSKELPKQRDSRDAPKTTKEADAKTDLPDSVCKSDSWSWTAGPLEDTPKGRAIYAATCAKPGTRYSDAGRNERFLNCMLSSGWECTISPLIPESPVNCFKRGLSSDSGRARKECGAVFR